MLKNMKNKMISNETKSTLVNLLQEEISRAETLQKQNEKLLSRLDFLKIKLDEAIDFIKIYEKELNTPKHEKFLVIQGDEE